MEEQFHTIEFRTRHKDLLTEKYVINEIKQCADSIRSFYILEIDVTGMNLSYLPDLSNFINLKNLYCAYNRLTELPPLNENLEILSCSHNFLKCLPPLNKKLKKLICYNNHIKIIPPFHSNLKTLYCSHNLLTCLPDLKKVERLVCDGNNMLCLPSITSNIHELYCDEISNYNVFNNFNFIINCEIIKTLLNFRFTYYCLKLKNKFKKWLWEKVREPKIMKKFHPDHLNELKENDDLEVFIEKWIEN